MRKIAKKVFFFFKNRRERLAREKRIAEALADPRERTVLPFRLAYVYRENPFEMHSAEMGLYLLRNFTPVKVIAFTEGERQRGQTHVTTESLLRQLDAFRPDAVFAFDKFFSPAEMAELKKRKLVVVATNDGFASFDSDVLPQPEAVKLIKDFDAFFVAHEPHVPRLVAEGVKAEPYALWADTDLFRPLPVKKDIDVLFIGTNSGHSRAYRQPILKRVSEVAQLTVAGPLEHYRELPRARAIGPVTDKHEINQLFNRAKIVLGSDRLIGEVVAANKRKDQVHFYDDVTFQVKDRTSCVLASGACYFVEDHEENRRLFRDGEEIVLFKSAEDLAGKIPRYLADAELRGKIGAKARARAVAEFSVEVRAKQMLDRVSQLVKESRP